jgi:DNA-binding transcriptional MerR regulator
MQKKPRNYHFDPACQYNKKEIAELTGLSKNVVTAGLEAAGLSTSRRSYSGQELLDQFVPIRQLIDSGMTYEEIEEMQRIRHAGNQDEGDLSDSMDGEGGDLGDFDQAVGRGMAQMMYGVAEAAVDDLVDVVPQLVGLAMGKAVRDGRLDAAFKRSLREHFAKRRRIDLGLGGSVEVPARSLGTASEGQVSEAPASPPSYGTDEEDNQENDEAPEE